MFVMACATGQFPVGNAIINVCEVTYVRVCSVFTATKGLRSMDDSLIYHATLGELYGALGEQEKAADAFHAAAGLAASTTLADLFRGRERLARGND